MKIHLVLLFPFLILAGCGGGLEGDLWEAEETMGKWTPELARRLAEKRSHPEVKMLIWRYFQKVAAQANPGQTPDEALSIIAGTFETDPLEADQYVAKSMVSLVEKDALPVARTWIKDYDQAPEVTKAIMASIEILAFKRRDETAAPLLGRLISELEARKTPLDATLLNLLANAAVAVPESVAGTYLKEGFPEDGAPMGTEKRIPPVGDARIRKAFIKGLKYLSKPYRAPELPMRVSLAKALEIHVRPSKEDADSYLKGLLPRAQKDEAYLDMTRVVAACAKDAAHLEAVAEGLEGKVKNYALRVAAKLGSTNVDAAALILKKYLSSPHRGVKSTAGKQAVADFITLKVKAVPALKTLLGKKDENARAVAVAAWGKIDAQGLATEMNRQLYPQGPVTWKTALEAIPLIQAVEGPAADEFFLRCLGFGGEPATMSARILKTRLDADRFTAGLFGLLVRKKTFGSREVDDYLKTLSSYAGVGTAVEKHLGRHLDAAGGRPEKVFWMVKYLSLRVLATRGGSTAAPLLEKLKTDPSSFTWISTRTDPATGAVISEERKILKFADEASAVLQAIEKRSR